VNQNWLTLIVPRKMWPFNELAVEVSETGHMSHPGKQTSLGNPVAAVDEPKGKEMWLHDR
jgi:hypothetical protein